MDLEKYIGSQLNNFTNAVQSLIPSANYSTGVIHQPTHQVFQTGDIVQPVMAQAPQPAYTPTPKMTQIPMNQDDQTLANNIRQGISNWTQNNSAPVPITNHIDAFVKAGQKFAQAGLDPYMPTIMALRETQGGRDLLDPNKNANLGNNNVFNLGGQQKGNNKRFVNYPDIETAVLGGQNDNGGQDPGTVSSGFTGTILDPKGVYSDFLKSKDMGDFFNHYSPPKDNNGDIPTQINNYKFMRAFFPGGNQ